MSASYNDLITIKKKKANGTLYSLKCVDVRHRRVSLEDQYCLRSSRPVDPDSAPRPSIAAREVRVPHGDSIPHFILPTAVNRLVMARIAGDPFHHLSA